jgi:hypothetical protein
MNNPRAVLILVLGAVAFFVMAFLVFPITRGYGDSIGMGEPETITARGEMLRAEGDKVKAEAELATAKATEWTSLTEVVKAVPDAIASVGVSAVQVGYSLLFIFIGGGVFMFLGAIALSVGANGVANALINKENRGFNPTALLERGFTPSGLLTSGDPHAPEHIRGDGVTAVDGPGDAARDLSITGAWKSVGDEEGNGPEFSGFSETSGGGGTGPISTPGEPKRGAGNGGGIFGKLRKPRG